MDLPISLFWRCHLFKMLSFARQRLQKVLSYFLLQSWCPHIALNKLVLLRSEGGANLPNIRAYHLSCLLRIYLDCIAHTSRYTNYDVKSHLATPYCLSALLHCKLWSIPPHLCQKLLLRDTLIAWRDVRCKLHISQLGFSTPPNWESLLPTCYVSLWIQNLGPQEATILQSTFRHEYRQR